MKHLTPLTCPACGAVIPRKAIKSQAAALASRARKTHGHGPGRPKKLSTCPRCGDLHGVVEMRACKA